MSLEDYTAVVEMHLKGHAPQDIADELGFSLAKTYRALQQFKATKSLERVRHLQASGMDDDYEEEYPEEEEEVEDDEQLQTVKRMLNGPEIAVDRRATFKAFRTLMKKAAKAPDEVTQEEVQEVQEVVTEFFVLEETDEEFDAQEIIDELIVEVEEVHQYYGGVRILGELALELVTLTSEGEFDVEKFRKLKLADRLRCLLEAFENVHGKELSQDEIGQFSIAFKGIIDEIPEDKDFDSLAIVMGDLQDQFPHPDLTEIVPEIESAIELLDPTEEEED